MARSVTERRQEILRLLDESSPRRLVELAELLGVSSVTLRRDVEDLASEGRLRRSHGGVARVERQTAARRAGGTFGLVMPHAEYYFGAVIDGIRAAAKEAGTRLTLGVSAYDLKVERRLVEGLVARGADGLLIAPTPDFATGELSAETQAWLESIPLPVVLVERPVRPGGCASELDGVSSAHGVGAASAVRHLVELGHRRLAFVAVTGPNTPHVRDGYRDAVAHNGVESVGEAYENLADLPALDAEVAALIERGATGLLVHNDQLAMRLLGRLEEFGGHVPDKLSVVCYDDISAELAQPALTAVAPQKEQVGRRAFALLAARVAHGAELGGAQHLQLVPQLHVRDSTSALAASA